MLAACSQAPATSPTAAPAAKPTSAPAAPAPTSAPVAAAPTTAPAVAAAKPSVPGAVSDAEWNSIVEAARKEGTLSLATYAGTSHRNISAAFEAAYPGIKVEHQQFQSSSRDYVPRLLQEQKAGLYTWDVAHMPVQEMTRQVRPAGGTEPVRPNIVTAEALDDKGWLDSYEKGYPDDDKKWGYALTRQRYKGVWINTDLVKEGEITRFDDLLDPKWKGKILLGDPRTKGSGFLCFTAIRVKRGDAAMTTIIKDLEAASGLDARQNVEQMIRGRYAWGIGAVDFPILKDFLAQGLGQNLMNVPMVETDNVNAGNRTMWYIKNAPHPNAAKVYMNWHLTREAGLITSQQVEENSRRADVPVFDESTALQKGLDYVFVDSEAMLDEIEKTQALAKTLIN
jgi:iron(III) transport system substrate-binding protein